MKLDILKYVYNQGLLNEWREECRLSQTNLIVGKNASGKSRIVKSIYLLSQLLSAGDIIEAHNDEWHLCFDIDQPESKTEYILKIEKGLVGSISVMQ